MKKWVILIILCNILQPVIAGDIETFIIPIGGDEETYIGIFGDEQLQNYFFALSNCSYYITETSCNLVSCTWCNGVCRDICTGGSGQIPPITGLTVIDNVYETRFVAVVKSLLIGEEQNALTNVIESFTDKYYCTNFPLGSLNFLFTHLFAFLVLWLVFSVIVRFAGATKKRRRRVKCCVYLIFIPFLALIISLMIPTCAVAL